MLRDPQNSDDKTGALVPEGRDPISGFMVQNSATKVVPGTSLPLRKKKVHSAKIDMQMQHNYTNGPHTLGLASEYHFDSLALLRGGKRHAFHFSVGTAFPTQPLALQRRMTL